MNVGLGLGLGFVRLFRFSILWVFRLSLDDWFVGAERPFSAQIRYIRVD